MPNVPNDVQALRLSGFKDAFWAERRVKGTRPERAVCDPGQRTVARQDAERERPGMAI